MANLSVTIKITPPGALSPQSVNQAITNGMRRVAFHMEGKAKDNITPFTKTGRLRSSVTSRSAGNRATIGTNVDYAPHVEYGTKPHTIRPVNKKALKWQGPSGPVFAKVVHHPGFKGHHYMKKTLDESLDDAKRIIEEELVKALG